MLSNLGLNQYSKPNCDASVISRQYYAECLLEDNFSGRVVLGFVHYRARLRLFWLGVQDNRIVAAIDAFRDIEKVDIQACKDFTVCQNEDVFCYEDYGYLIHVDQEGRYSLRDMEIYWKQQLIADLFRDSDVRITNISLVRAISVAEKYVSVFWLVNWQISDSISSHSLYFVDCRDARLFGESECIQDISWQPLKQKECFVVQGQTYQAKLDAQGRWYIQLLTQN